VCEYQIFSVSVCKVDVGFKIMIKNSNTATCAAVIYTISTSYYLQHSLHLAIFRMISNYLKPFYDRFLCLFTWFWVTLAFDLVILPACLVLDIVWALIVRLEEKHWEHIQDEWEGKALAPGSFLSFGKQIKEKVSKVCNIYD